MAAALAFEQPAWLCVLGRALTVPAAILTCVPFCIWQGEALTAAVFLADGAPDEGPCLAACLAV